MRVAIANQKGGVGKTTTAVNVAAALAGLGHRTLIVDLDPQANATTGVGVDHRDVRSSVYDVIIEGRPAEETIVPTAYEHLSLLPSSIDLAGAELELVPAFARESKLRVALEPIEGRYDAIFIDCPPSLGLLTVNALTAAHWMLVPIQCEYYALEGVSQLLRNVDLVRAGLNPGLEIGGIVLTMYDARTKLSEQVAEEVREYFGDRVFSTVVPRSVRLSEAPSYGQPAISFDPSSRGSLAYRWLAEEFAARFLDGSDLEGPPEPAVPPEAIGGTEEGGPESAGVQDEASEPEPAGEPPGIGGGDGASSESLDETQANRVLSPSWAFSVARNLLGPQRRAADDHVEPGGTERGGNDGLSEGNNAESEDGAAQEQEEDR